jgi:hypothetical protein
VKSPRVWKQQGTHHACAAHAERDFAVFGLFLNVCGRTGRQIRDRNVSQKSKGTDLSVLDRLSDLNISDGRRENTGAFDDLVEPTATREMCAGCQRSVSSKYRRARASVPSSDAMAARAARPWERSAAAHRADSGDDDLAAERVGQRLTLAESLCDLKHVPV